MQEKYKYRLRPYYGSDPLLLEFTVDSPDVEIEKDLFEAIKELDPIVEDLQDLWMNDEVVITVSCSKGGFILTKDIWGLVFIMAGQNQPCIMAINEILERSEMFVREEVDYSLYRSSQKE
jgi:hypothetical protein